MNLTTIRHRYKPSLSREQKSADIDYSNVVPRFAKTAKFFSHSDARYYRFVDILRVDQVTASISERKILTPLCNRTLKTTKKS